MVEGGKKTPQVIYLLFLISVKLDWANAVLDVRLVPDVIRLNACLVS